MLNHEYMYNQRFQTNQFLLNITKHPLMMRMAFQILIQLEQ